MESKINELIEKLNKLGHGPVPDSNKTEVLNLLSGYWQYLKGSDNQKTLPYKLSRAENLSWDGSILSFVLERHGSTVNGSSRAELHHWDVNLVNNCANISKTGIRQIYPIAPRMDIKQKANEVAEQILSREQHENIEWRTANHVVLNISRIIPETNMKTTTDRRKRFRAELEKIMSNQGCDRKDFGSKMGFVLPDATISNDQEQQDSTS